MAEMESVLNYLKKQVEDNQDIFRVIKDDVSKLFQELDFLRAFLRDAIRRQEFSAAMKHIVRECRKIVNQVENLIDKFMIEAILHQKKKVAKFFDVSRFTKIRHCSAEIKFITEKLKDIRRDVAFSLSASRPFEEDNTQIGLHRLKRAPFVEEDEVVGFHEEADSLIHRLREGSDDLEFIPIVGMPGLGKTTIANMIYNSNRVGYDFVVRIWIYVSQSYNLRKIFLHIISQFTGDIKQYQFEHMDALAKVVHNYLLGRKYLIVLDDIWSLEAFDGIKVVLPDNHNGSRALLTTRDRRLAIYCNKSPHDLKFLREDECWELLQKKVFRRGKCPPDLEELGKSIVKTCSGLPLATLLIAAELASTGWTRSEWKRVHERVGECMISRDTGMIMELVHMSYDSLPFNLKACFLYCSIFPRGYDIPAWKIVLLWIAEGFVVDSEQSILETLAEEYLNVLVSKSLLMVTRRTSTGQIKTFRMHDMLYEFCTLEASEENLFKRIKLGVEQTFPRNQELATFRRLCIDSSVEEFISTKPFGEGIRSFLCFSSQEIMMAPTSLETIAKAFPLLRVFYSGSILLSRFLKQFGQLYHLRYIALSSGSLKVLPTFMEELWNLQTLIIFTQENVVHIEADICSMPRLRHFYINASAKLLPSAAVKTNKPGVLRTLSTIEPESCTEHMSARCPNLKKLGICGKISKHDGLFLNVNKLKYLEKLKLVNDHLADEKLLLPSPNIFPVNLQQLTLSGTRLGWNEMGRLSHLKVLEVLKLKENAFTGDSWESTDVFTCLKVLWIEKSDLVSWKASNQPFPSLERLVLRYLDKLEEVPIEELANINKLKMMELEYTTTKTVESARRIKSLPGCTELKLSIFPQISYCN